MEAFHWIGVNEHLHPPRSASLNCENTTAAQPNWKNIAGTKNFSISIRFVAEHSAAVKLSTLILLTKLTRVCETERGSDLFILDQT